MAGERADPAAGAPGPESRLVFDRALVRRHRERAAAGFAAHDFLKREVAERLSERLDDIKRRFPLALDLACHDGAVGRAVAGRGGIRQLIQCDLSEAMVTRARGGPRAVADEEWLPFKAASLDLVLSVLGLHWVNDLPGALVQIRRALKPDGLLLAAMLGGETLCELRQAFLSAEAAREGGASPRVSPFADVRDVGALLLRTGYDQPVVDSERITTRYPDALALMRDLRGMAEANASVARRPGFTRRETLLAAAAAYRDRFADASGRVPATFEVLYITAWCPPAA